MAKSADQVRSFLASSGILDNTSVGESCVVIIPTSRLNSGQIALMLRANGVQLRVLGQGAGTVKDRSGLQRKVKNLLVLAVPNKHLIRVELYTKLYGSFSVKIPK